MTTLQILEVLIKARDEFTPIAKAMDQTIGKAAASMEKFATGNQQSFTAVAEAGGIIAGAVVAAGAAIYELGQRGAVVGDVARNFEYLTKGAGESADVMLGKLRQGTVGTISDFDLMKMANKAIGDGLKLTADDAGTMAAAARELGKRVGIDTKEAFEELSTSMATGKVKGLAHLGMMVDQTKAVLDYQVAHGKLGQTLTDTEHRAAIQAATMTALGRVVKDAGDQDKDFGEKIDAIRIKFANWIDQLSILVNDSPVLAAGLDAVTKALDDAFGGNTAGALQFVMGLIHQFAIGVVTAGQVAVEVARFISDAWNGLKVIFSAVMAATLEPLRLVVDGIELLAEKASMIPGVGPKIAAMVPGLRDVKNAIDGVTDSFVNDAVSAVDDAAAQNHALDAVSDALGKVKTALVAANDQYGTAKTVTQAHTVAVKEHVAAVGQSIKQTEIMAGLNKELSAALGAYLPEYEKQIDAIRAETAAKIASYEIDLKKNAITPQEFALDKAKADRIRDLSVAYIEQQHEVQQMLALRELEAAKIAAQNEAYDKLISAGEDFATTFGGKVGAALTGTTKVFDSALTSYRGFQQAFFSGDTVGMITSGIGVVTSLAKGAISAIGSLFGGEARKVAGMRDDFLKSAGGLQELTDKARHAGITLDALFSAKKVTDFNKAVENVKTGLLRQGFIDDAGGIDILRENAEAAGVSLDAMLKATNVKDYQKAVDDLNAAFALHQSAVEDTQKAIDKYGITVDEMGPKWAKQELDKKAMELLKDYELLSAAGADQTAVIEHMGPALNAYVDDCLKAGVAIPENMKPALQKMAEMGLLTDENGQKITDVSKLNFTKDLTTQVQDLVQSIKDLVDALRGIPKNVDTSINVSTNIPGAQGANPGAGQYVPNVPTQADIDRMRNEHHAAQGFSGWVNAPTRFLTGEGGEPEHVEITPRSKMGGSGDGGAPQILHADLHIDGVKFGTVVTGLFRTNRIRVNM